MRLDQPLRQGARFAPEAPLALQAWKPEGEGQPGIAPEGQALGGAITEEEGPARVEVAQYEGANGNGRAVLLRIAEGGKPAQLRVGVAGRPGGGAVFP